MRVFKFVFYSFVLIQSLFVFNVNASSYSRSDLEDMVVSTALSYYYNNLYSDYGQYLKDTGYGFKSTSVGGTYAWRNLTYSPEDISRGNKYFIDCSSFAAITYKYALGYDFSDHYKNSRYSYFRNGKKYGYYNMTSSNVKAFPDIFYGVKQDQSLYQDMAKYMGLDNDGTYYALISKNVSSSDKVNVSGGTSAYMNNSILNKTQAVYYYEASGSSISDIRSQISGKRSKIFDEIKSVLRPGDMLTYSSKVKNSDGTASKIKGHVMIYVGDALLSGEQGFIHSTGYDYTYNSDGSMKSPGDDTYSVRYDTIDYLSDKVLSESDTTIGYRVSIQRPINQFCNGNNCSFDTSSSSFSKAIDKSLISNSVSRNEFSRLRVEHYAMGDKINNVLSKYNSVNVGDSIKYYFQIQNKANYSFCSRGAYYTKSACENNGYVWRYSNRDNIYDYKDLRLVSKIPDGTYYVNNSCTGSCVYDKDSNTISWDISSVSPNSEMVTSVYSGSNPTYIYTYSVKTKRDGVVSNDDSYLVSSSGNKLYFGDIDTMVNPTINEDNINDMNGVIDRVNGLVTSGNVSYSSSGVGNYKVNLDGLNSNISLSSDGFIKLLYYNYFGVDLGYLDINNIVNAIFNKRSVSDNKESVSIYYTKNKSEISNLSSVYKKIHDMLVPGMYGGRVLHGNDNGDREKMISSRNNTFFSGIGLNNFEYGDVLVTISSNMKSMDAFMYMGQDSSGYPVFVSFTKNGIVKYDRNNVSETGFMKMASIYSKDLFVVLRPSRIASNISYDFNGGKSSVNSFIAFDNYGSLVRPSKDSYKVSIDYNRDISNLYSDVFYSKNSFEGWYSDKNFSNKVSFGSKVSGDVIYAKYNASSISLPDISMDGANIDGYYSDSGLTKKVGNPGDSYVPSGDETLYVKWNNDSYKVSYDLDGGINNINNPSSYNDGDEKVLYNPSKNGYVFEGWYSDKDFSNKVVSVSGNGNLTLYAKWSLKKFSIKYVLNGGINNLNNVSSYEFGKSVRLLNPSKSGYIFEGWYLDSSYRNRVSVIDFNRDVVLYAKFKRIEVMVPNSFSASALNYVSIKLSWNKVSGASGYQVCKYSNGKYYLIKTVTGNSVITTYRNKTGYYSYYKIRSYKKIGNDVYYSKFTNVVKAKPFLSSAGNVKLKKISKNSVKLSWNKVNGASGYSIYRYSSGSKRYVVIKNTGNLYFNNRSLRNKTMYYYKIRSYRIVDGKKVYGGYSKIVKIRI